MARRALFLKTERASLAVSGQASLASSLALVGERASPGVGGQASLAVCGRASWLWWSSLARRE
eukprot:1919252-Pleurochrysis_carterae.AAC.1